VRIRIAFTVFIIMAIATLFLALVGCAPLPLCAWGGDWHDEVPECREITLADETT
jgi:hypothetical protein